MLCARDALSSKPSTRGIFEQLQAQLVELAQECERVEQKWAAGPKAGARTGHGPEFKCAAVWFEPFTFSARFRVFPHFSEYIAFFFSRDSIRWYAGLPVGFHS